MASYSLLGGVPTILNAERQTGEADAVLALVDQALDGRIDEPMWVTVHDIRPGSRDAGGP